MRPVTPACDDRQPLRTDVIANVAMIVAALLVRLFDANVPDLLVAVLIALVVLNGAIRILRLR